MVVKVYYWPGFMGRAGASIRMLHEAGVAFEHVSDMGEMSQKAAAFGAETGNIAPPIVEDGDLIYSQSTACAMYIGKTYGFPAPDDCKAVQIMEDIKDKFENGISKNQEDAKKLKEFLKGDGTKPSRFSVFASAIERNVVGPFFFGEKMSYVDFYFANAYASNEDGMKKLMDKTGDDFFTPYPKLQAIAKAIRGLESMKGSDLITLPADMFGIKDEVVEEYMKL
ncbi:Glutathione S-Transferase [Seminavis robusta]|uniref:Glutathione S-Transferase n=1 Tax=Seminavis robusta TaxID=568900 RepID=A0A9N8H713_9STRA|nr:Glutathione S-Transferase [Seminavis robusta]|eukprot:Sro164_g073450.1 Glutathione S-Transferase (224) ;mRNA; f:5172-5843